MTHNTPDADRARALMMAALDGEIAPADQRQLDALLADSAELAGEWRRLTRVREVTRGLTLEKLPEEVWDRYWTSVYRRAERRVAWTLVSLGALVLLGYWLWDAAGALLTDPSIPPLIRVAVVAVAVGAAILLVSVAREKVVMYRTDPYKEIVR